MNTILYNAKNKLSGNKIDSYDCRNECQFDLIKPWFELAQRDHVSIDDFVNVLSTYKEKSYSGTSLNIEVKYFPNNYHERIYCSVTMGGYIQKGDERYFMFSAGVAPIRDVLLDALMCVQKR